MLTFTFEGRDKHGSLVTGQRKSESSENLSKQLFAEGITPINITPFDETSNLFLRIKKVLFRKKITNSQLSLFTRQMYTLNKSGVVISSAIKQLAQTSRNPYFSEVLLGISQKLESGQNLASAMEEYSDVFPPLMIAMVKVGQSTGQLDNAFLRLTEYLELEGSIIKRVKSAIRYPVFVVISIVIGVIIINIFVIPTFAKVYVRAGIPMPWLTRMLVAMSNFIVMHWFFMIVVLVGIVFGIIRYLRSPQGKYKWHRLQLKIPIIGFLLQRVILLRFSETFAIVVNSGIPINDGLALVAQSIGNTYARKEIHAMKDSIQRGNSIVQAASTTALFTPLELQMLSISEQTGELGAVLNDIALYYQREVDYDLKHLMDIIEPILLIGIAIMVLFLAMAVYMPIWNMVKLVHRG